MTKKSVTTVSDNIDSGNSNTESIKGDKKKVCDSSKRFTFTLNNYTEEEHDKLVRFFCDECDIKWVIGYETAPTTGTPHLQGYVEIPNKIRPKRYFGMKRAHWEIAGGCRAMNVDYCTKGGLFIGNLKPKASPKHLAKEAFYIWQMEIYDLLTQTPNDRHIHWVIDEIGNCGKTAFCKAMCIQHNALVLEGKSTDMFHGIAGYYNTHGYYPSIILIDVPRESLGYVNYAAIEKIKNGLLFSGKYEGKLLVFDPPHIVVFANNSPKMQAFSADRWQLHLIDSETMSFIPDEDDEEEYYASDYFMNGN